MPSLDETAEKARSLAKELADFAYGLEGAGVRMSGQDMFSIGYVAGSLYRLANDLGKEFE